MNEGWLIGGMALLTFALRYALLGMSEKVTLSQNLTHILRYAPPAVLTAIVTPSVLMPQGELLLTHTNARLVGAIAAIVMSYRTKNLLLTIVSGMLTFLLWQWLLSSR